MSDNHWYAKVVSGELHQGDFVENCPIITPTLESYLSVLESQKETDNIEAEIETYDTIIMTQSCDIQKPSVKLILVCPMWSLEDFSSRERDYANDNMREALRRGYVFGYHLLNRCHITGFERDLLVVDFRSVFSLPKTVIEGLIQDKERLRLLPPYREHLAQAFARFFMRVGLPVDIPAFGSPAIPSE